MRVIEQESDISAVIQAVIKHQSKVSKLIAEVDQS